MNKILFTLLLLSPLPLFAANGISDVQVIILNLFGNLSYLFMAGTVAFFAYGVVKFILNADDSTEREKGRQFILWAIISFVVIVSIWGLVSFLLGSFGITAGGTPGWIVD